MWCDSGNSVTIDIWGLRETLHFSDNHYNKLNNFFCVNRTLLLNLEYPDVLHRPSPPTEVNLSLLRLQ